MSIKFRSGFLHLLKLLILIAGAILLVWVTWIWRATIGYVALFMAMSVIRTVINAMFIVGVAFLIGWFLPWTMAKYVLLNVVPPHAPLRLWKYALVVSVVLGFALTPMNMRVHAKITQAVAPLADQFSIEAGCDGSGCWAPQNILRQRDQLVRAYGGIRIGGWYVTGAWRYDSGVDTDRVVYLWKAPFFVF